MRLITILLFALLWATDSYGQSESAINVNSCITVDNTDIQSEMLSFDYKQTEEWKRYKTLKAIGWTAVGIGGIMLTGGCICDAFDNSERGGNIKWRFRIVWIVGAGIAAASVPLLTFAYINRHKAKKAAALSLTASRLSVDLPTGGRQSRPTLGISINF